MNPTEWIIDAMGMDLDGMIATIVCHDSMPANDERRRQFIGMDDVPYGQATGKL